MAAVTVFRANTKARPPVRVAQSCVPCKKIKQKCDRGLPCGACRRRNMVTACTYAFGMGSQTLPTPRTPTTTEDALRARIDALERRLEVQQQAPLLDEEPILPISPSISADSATSQDTATNNSLGNNESASGVQSCNYTVPREAGLHILPDIALAEMNSGTTPSMALFGVCSTPSIDNLLRMLPSMSLCDRLLEAYFSTFSPLFHILHDPTFRMEYNSFQRDMSNVDTSWLALLFTLLALAVTTLDDGDETVCDISMGLTSTAVAALYRRNAMICLAAGDFLLKHNLHTIQALVLLIYATNHSEGLAGSWGLLGLAQNLGTALRYHRDDDKDCFISREQKRRCWAGLLMLHTISAVSFDNVQIPSLTEHDTELPADLNDIDIQVHGVSQASSSPTQMSYMLYKFRLYRLSTRVCELVRKPVAMIAYNDILELDMAIAVEQSVWDERYLRDGGSCKVERHNQAQWNILHMYAHQMYLLLHRSFFRTNEAIDDCTKFAVC